MTDCRWILSKRISRSPKFQVVSHRDLEHDSFLVFYYDLHRLGDGVSDSAKCACPRTGFLVLRRHENRKQRSWRAHLSDTRYGDKEAPRGGGKKRRILTQLFVSPLNYGFLPLSQWERCRKHLMPALLFPQWPVAGSGAETRGLVDERKWKDEGWSRLELLLPVCV